MRRRFSRLALAVTAVAVVAIAGAVTYAVADIGGGGVINGCYKSQNGQLRLIDPATDSCNPSETAISWNTIGEGRKGRRATRVIQGRKDLPDRQDPPVRKGLPDRKGLLGLWGLLDRKGLLGRWGRQDRRATPGPPVQTASAATRSEARRPTCPPQPSRPQSSAVRPAR